MKLWILLNYDEIIVGIYDSKKAALDWKDTYTNLDPLACVSIVEYELNSNIYPAYMYAEYLNS